MVEIEQPICNGGFITFAESGVLAVDGADTERQLEITTSAGRYLEMALLLVAL